MPQTTRAPAYCLHKASGRAVVRLSGRDFYLGEHGSPESHERYAQLVSKWLSGGRSVLHLLHPPGVVVAELVEAFDHWAREQYPDAPNGGQRRNILDALAPAVQLFASTEVDRFGPMELRAVRQRMLDGGRLARTTINARINRIRFVWRWAVGHELAHPDTLARLRCVEPLRRGARGTRETPPVRGVAVAVVLATVPALADAVAAMVQVQLHTACRPGEVVGMHADDVDRSSDVWLYAPRRHKMSHTDAERTIPIGPQAQALLGPRLDAGGWSFASRSGKPFTTMSYARAVARACKAANVPHWSPNQLRHSGLSHYREEAGLEAAQYVAGHSRLETTQIYAERRRREGTNAVRRIG